jgi:hypothetical protein
MTPCSQLIAPPIRKLVLDRRLGGIERWIFATDTELMQIPDEVLKCVAYACSLRKVGSQAEFHIDGTVFFVGYPVDGTPGSACYAVTARHVIDSIKTKGVDHQSYLRINPKSGNAIVGAVPLDSWVMHDDPRVDVAVAPIAIDWPNTNQRMLPVGMFLNDEVIRREEIGVGEDLFFPGVFVHRPGEESNIPIVRMGNIASMPGERIQTKFGNLLGYLAEARSIGGLSGSPAFVHTGGMRHMTTAIRAGGGGIFFLGLVHGHYGTRDILDAADDVLIDSEGSKSVNMGIAIIVPAYDVKATLDHPSLITQRQKAKEEFLKTREAALPEMDSREPPATSPPQS